MPGGSHLPFTGTGPPPDNRLFGSVFSNDVDSENPVWSLLGNYFEKTIPQFPSAGAKPTAGAHPGLKPGADGNVFLPVIQPNSKAPDKQPRWQSR